jgi:murein DD-endopeptidase MepM/ murein hydrolase activator NlpD
MGVPEKGQIIALTTALVESNLKNYANNGVFDVRRNPADATLADPTPILAFISKSMDFPHDATGSDATSVGLFQQQAWWGTVGTSTWSNDPNATITRLMDPAFQAQKFYSRMLSIPSWEQMDYGVVAQKVQVSSFPSAYNLRLSEAKDLYAQYVSEPTSVTLYDFGAVYEGAVKIGTDCGAGATALVLDKTSLYQVTSQWAQPPLGIRQGRSHGGMDIDCDSAYEKVYTPIDGTVVISVPGNSTGKGNPMGQVKLKSADGTLFTFMHTRNTFVKAGDVIAECASTGNSTGSHLHLETSVTNSTNPAVQALPNAADKGLRAGLRDPALVLELLGVDICPPYTANRKTVAVGAALPTTYMKCWPPEEWVR